MSTLKNKDYAIELLSNFDYNGELVLASATVFYEGTGGRLFSHAVTTARKNFLEWRSDDWCRFIETSQEYYGASMLKRVEAITLSLVPGGLENYILEATDLDMAGFNRIVLSYNPPFLPKNMFMLNSDEQKNIGSVSSVLLAAQMVAPDRLISVKSDEPVAIIVRRIAKHML